tara:strand:- start:512 stop:1510 length:999 start_codon:yes stop_codon:yes gene_type:complete
MILRVIEKLKIGGVERGILEELKNIDDYKLVVINRVENLNLSEDLKEKIEILNTNWFNMPKFISFSIKDTSKPNIIVTSLWKSFLFAIIYKIINRSKLICFFHSNKFTNPLSALVSKIGILFSSKLFCDSEAVRLFLKNISSSKKIKIIPYKFKLDSKKTALDFSNGLKPVFIGRIHKVKRIDKIIQLHAYLKKHTSISDIDFYGPIEDEKSFNEIESYKNSHYKGILNFNKVNNTLVNYNCIFLMSDREGMGEIVFNAMQLGVIPIVKPVGEINNYVIDNINGFHINDFEMLKDNIVKMSEEKKLSLISEEAKKVADNTSLYINEFMKYAK